jgi:beta-glucosidase
MGTFGFRGFTLSVDDSVVVESDWGSEMPIHGSVELTAGRAHRIRLEGSCYRSGSLVQLLWEIPRQQQRDDEALRMAREADAVVLVLGLSPRIEGEEMPVDVKGFRGGDRTDIALPEAQERLLRSVVQVGKPVVLVLLNGSAVAIPWAAEHVPAILECWYPGQDGGTAIAEALFGDLNPGGKLPVTFYRSVHDLPPFADYSMKERTHRFFTGTPLFPFGHGLSYTRFDYRSFHTSASAIEASPDARLTLDVDIVNAGERAGDEVVQFYVRALDSQVSRPEHELRGFRRVSLGPGEKRTVQFEFRPSDVAYYNSEKHGWTIEPGRYELRVGSSSSDIRAKATVTINQ